MMKRFLLAALALVGASMAHAQTSQVIGSGVINPGAGMYAPLIPVTAIGNSTSTVQYVPMAPSGSDGGGFSANTRVSYLTAPVKMINLTAHAETAMTSGIQRHSRSSKMGRPHRSSATSTTPIRRAVATPARRRIARPAGRPASPSMLETASRSSRVRRRMTRRP